MSCGCRLVAQNTVFSLHFLFVDSSERAISYCQSAADDLLVATRPASGDVANISTKPIREHALCTAAGVLSYLQRRGAGRGGRDGDERIDSSWTCIDHAVQTNETGPPLVNSQVTQRVSVCWRRGAPCATHWCLPVRPK